MIAMPTACSNFILSHTGAFAVASQSGGLRILPVMLSFLPGVKKLKKKISQWCRNKFVR